MVDLAVLEGLAGVFGTELAHDERYDQILAVAARIVAVRGWSRSGARIGMHGFPRGLNARPRRRQRSCGHRALRGVLSPAMAAIWS